MKINNTYYPSSKSEWHNWLQKNHKKEKEICIIYYKKHTNKPRISNKDAVEEALCLGWIDSTVKKIDNQKYCQRFTPRKDKSEWSELNKTRTNKLIKENRMHKLGLEKVKKAKLNGMWNKQTVANQSFDMPLELQNILSRNNEVNQFFQDLAPSHNRNYINWITSAKKEETRVRRTAKAFEILRDKKTLGII